MKHLISIFAWAFLGGVLTVAVIFLDRTYALIASGQGLATVPLPVLLVDVMELPAWAISGALGGAALATLLKIPALWRWLWKDRKTEESELIPFKDADDVIKALRKDRAEKYLAERKKR
jgi:hypothetical protein